MKEFPSRITTERLDLLIEESRRTITVLVKFKYFWEEDFGASSWTYGQKRHFHNELDKIVWNIWGTAFYLECYGTSDFAKRHKGKRWDLNFDIEWVHYDEHWKVYVHKGDSFRLREGVKWNQGMITLYSDSYKKNHVVKRFGSTFTINPFAHEFGHVIGNSITIKDQEEPYFRSHGDEYNRWRDSDKKEENIYYYDLESIMNAGNELRQRHIDFIVYLLSKVRDNTKFRAI